MGRGGFPAFPRPSAHALTAAASLSTHDTMPSSISTDRKSTILLLPPLLLLPQLPLPRLAEGAAAVVEPPLLPATATASPPTSIPTAVAPAGGGLGGSYTTNEIFLCVAGSMNGFSMVPAGEGGGMCCCVAVW